jgi:hypothetical protein
MYLTAPGRGLPDDAPVLPALKMPAGARLKRTTTFYAPAAHGKHEKRFGKADANWPDWYAEYLVQERTGEELPQ